MWSSGPETLRRDAESIAGTSSVVPDLTRALVLGGGGFIGVAACKELMRRGVETIAAGRKERPYGIFTSYVAFDRSDEEQLRRALAQVQPDVLLDLACFQPEDVAAVARVFDGQRYVFVSTGVYPNLDGRPAREDDFVPLEGAPPDSLDYMDGKRWCETVLARTRDLPWTVVRPPAVFGAADSTLRIAAYIQRVADGGPLLVPAESYERQAGLAWVKDIGFACALACDLRKDTLRKAYNAAFEGVSLRDLIEGIARAFGMPPRIHPIPYTELPPDASPYGPDPRRSAGYMLDRARRELGFEPSALEDALAETLAWYRVVHPSHPGYANRAAELALVGAA
jgi:nucleoside-diphosphate-sugar epimerase